MSNIVKRAFKRYYFYRFDIEMKRMDEREFGYATFDGRMIRHLSFANKDELRALLIREVPADVYASNAYYTNPTAEMELKNWLGADLIFDIDIKDLLLPCMKEHRFGICSVCNNVGNGNNCTICNANMNEVNLPCSNCIEAGKREVSKLLELLKELGANDIIIYFSGNNGFHIHVRDADLSYLSAESRRDIADYIRGNGITPEFLGITRDKSIISIKNAVSSERGWRGRIVRGLLVDKDRDRLVRSLARRGYDAISKELKDVAYRLGVAIDTVVTIDTHRIFRLENTLSSKSGLAKIKVDDIDRFDPYKDAVLIDDEPIEVKIHYSPRFTMMDKIFGPYKDAIASLPSYAAVYLICKGLASEPKVLN